MRADLVTTRVDVPPGTRPVALCRCRLEAGCAASRTLFRKHTAPTYALKGRSRAAASPGSSQHRARWLGRQRETRCLAVAPQQEDYADASDVMESFHSYSPEQLMLLMQLSSLTTYPQLSQFVQRHWQAFDHELCTFPLLHAASLYETLSLDAAAATEGGLARLADLEALLDDLTDLIKPHVLGMPTDAHGAALSALNQLGYYDEALYSLMASACHGSLDCPQELMAHNLAMLAAAFAGAGHYDSQLMDYLGDQVAAHAQLFESPQQLIAILSDFQILQHPHAGLLQAVADATSQFLPELEVAGACSVALSLAFFGAGQHRELLQRLLARLAGVPRSSLPQQQLPQLYRLVQLLDGKIEVPPGLAELAAGGQAACREANLASYLGHALHPSAVDQLRQRAPPEVLQAYETSGKLVAAEVFGLLETLGFGPQLGEATADGTFPVSIAVSIKGMRVAVQVLQVTDCCSNLPSRLRGSVAIDHMLMERQGWALLPVPAQEWLQLGGGQEEQTPYLVRRLKAVAS